MPRYALQTIIYSSNNKIETCKKTVKNRSSISQLKVLFELPGKISPTTTHRCLHILFLNTRLCCSSDIHSALDDLPPHRIVALQRFFFCHFGRTNCRGMNSPSRGAHILSTANYQHTTGGILAVDDVIARQHMSQRT